MGRGRRTLDRLTIARDICVVGVTRSPRHRAYQVARRFTRSIALIHSFSIGVLRII
jgi:predicted CoA-binding protein